MLDTLNVFNYILQSIVDIELMLTQGLYFAVWFPFSVACALSLSTVGRLTRASLRHPFIFMFTFV